MSGAQQPLDIMPHRWLRIAVAIASITMFGWGIPLAIIDPTIDTFLRILLCFLELVGASLSVFLLINSVPKEWKLRLTEDGITIRTTHWIEPSFIPWENIESIGIEQSVDTPHVAIRCAGKRRAHQLDRIDIDRSLQKMVNLLEEKRSAALAVRIWRSGEPATPFR